MRNFWLDRAETVIETERLLVKQSDTAQAWYGKMPSVIPMILPGQAVFRIAEDFGPRVGEVRHLRLTRMGIEGVLRAARKYHRLASYVYYDSQIQPAKPFWVVMH